MMQPFSILTPFFCSPFRLHGRHDPSFSNTLEEMDDLAFFRQLRLSKAAFSHLLSFLPQEEGGVHRRGKKEISLNESLQITLWYLANKTV